MKLETSSALMPVILGLALMTAGGLSVSTAYLYWVNGVAADLIKRLEADARTAWGKYHNYSEEVEDLLEAARSEKTLELWTVQGKLDACLKDKK